MISMIKSLHWDITDQCNLRCRHCYNFNKYFKHEERPVYGSVLSYNECLQVIDKFCQDGFKHIHFLGGEPLCRPDIIDIIRYAKKKTMIVSINSNAILLDDKLQLDLIECELDQFAASIDGCSSDVNDSIRGKGTFDLICRNMNKFAEKVKKHCSKCQLALVFTLTRANLKELMGLPALAHRLGVNLVVLTLFIESGRGKEYTNDYKCEVDLICDAIEQMVKNEWIKYSDIFLQIDMRPRFCEYLATVYGVPVIYNIKNSLCCAGEEVWYMEADGFLHPCLVYQLDCGKNAIKRGDLFLEWIQIQEYSSLEYVRQTKYWNSFLFNKHKFNVKELLTCIDCSHYEICMPCPFEYTSPDIKVEECEWTKNKEKELVKQFMKHRIQICQDVYIDKDYILYKNGKAILSFENELSIFIWQQLQNNHLTFDEILTKILNIYGENNKNHIEIDLVYFILNLRNHGLVNLV